MLHSLSQEMSQSVNKEQESASESELEGSFEGYEQPSVRLHHQPKDARTKAKYNIFSRLYFFWLDPLVWLGCRSTLEQTDLYAHPSETDSEKLLNRFNRHWKYELERKKAGKKPRLLLAVLKCLYWRLLMHGTLMFVEIASQVGQSVLLGYLSDYFTIEDPTGEETRNAYLFAMGLTLLALVIMMLHGHSFLTAYKIGMLTRIIMTSAIYQKILSLSQVTIGKLSIGRVVNLASNDVQRFDLAFLFVHVSWIAPIHLGVVTYLVYLEIGWSALMITGFVLIQVPLQVLLAKMFAVLRFKSAILTDKRVRIMNEIISGIRVIKMYAWENAFKRLVFDLRRKESNVILKGGIVRAVSLGFMIVSLTLIMYLVFSVYTGTGGILSPKKVFTTLSLLIVLRLTSVHFAIQAALAISEGRVAVVRLRNLLEMDELLLPEKQNSCSETQEDSCVKVDNLLASWNYDQEKLVLNDVSFEVNQEHPLLAVVGHVGSGKSTLLQCLLRELSPMSGRVDICGRVSYASQEPWVFSSTLRENVLFGQKYDPIWYNTVIEACALDKDLKQLADGDLTLVGERGVTLSGGQKARVNLARAVYREADLYLLDDPLSAVDIGVARHIFQKCIRGLLRDKLVVLVTHQVQFALQADKLLALNEGHIEVYGSHSELMSRGMDLRQLFGLIAEQARDEEEREDEFVCKETFGQVPVSSSTHSHRPPPLSPLVAQSSRCEEQQINGFIPPSLPLPSPTDPPPFLQALSPTSKQHLHPMTPRRRKRQLEGSNLLPRDISFETSPFDTTSIYSAPSLLSLQSIPEGLQNGAEEEIELKFTTTTEEKSHGSITMKTYYKYMKSGGSLILLAFVLVVSIVAEGGIVISDWWISDWAQCSQMNNISLVDTNVSIPSICLLTTSQRIAIFSATTWTTFVLNIAKTVLFYFVCVNASRVLHDRMFASLLRAPISFFDTNSIGQVLNRFSKDVGFLDDLLPYVFAEFYLIAWRSVAILVTAIGANVWISIPAVILVVVFLLLRWYYLKTSREVKRLEAIARSPIYSHISTTLQGLSVIRSFEKQEVAIQLFHTYHNQHSQGYYLYLALSRWFGMRIDLITAIFLAAVAFISVPLASQLSAGLVGLSLTYTISLTGMLQYAVRQGAEVENIMISAERILDYTKLDSEASLETLPPNEKPPSNWPDKGKVTFEDVAFQYSPDLPLVLKNLCVTIKPSEKVGIVGRTGAGKSSLISVLYRLAEPFGLITIDDVDTKSIGLHDLRKKMSIIPQDPVLFSGTMRYNLDPFDEYSDTELWEALEQVQLKAVVQQLEGQLSAEVSEGGSNFSVGQRQLVCLARALLRKNKILVLDEATANVDHRTDEIIQMAIREKFSKCTVLTIAHRLNTIMDSDRVLVMSNGQMKEFDTPYNLVQNTKSQLYSMVGKTGPIASKKLRQMALDAHLQRKKSSHHQTSPSSEETPLVLPVLKIVEPNVKRKNSGTLTGITTMV